MDSGGAPPSGWRWVLGRALPPRDREALVDELDRMYARRVTEDGDGAARRWYREEVMAFVLRVPDQGVRGLKISVGGWMMNGLRQLGIVLRGLRRTPGFASLAVVTLALGIGANALIFSIADRAVFRPLPYPEPDRLVAVMEGWTTSLGGLEILQRDMTTVEAIGGALDASGMTYERTDGPARRVSVSMASPEYFDALRVQPIYGRTFRAEEVQPGLDHVALLSSDFFETTFGGDPSVLGSSMVLDAESYQIVGVLPAGFDLPSARNDLWIPATMDGSPENVGYHWGMGAFTMVARMGPGATTDAVKADALRAQEDIRLANPLWTPPPGFWDEGRVSTLQEARGRWARTPLLILLGAVAVVLLVVCANLANLLLSRGLSRQRDLAVRTALGAGGSRLAAGQITEVVVLAMGGAVLGLVLASAGLELIRPLLPSEIPGIDQVGLDVRVIGFTLVVALAVALLAGVAPAFRVFNQSPGDLLREGGRGRTATRARRRTTNVLVTAQMAAAVVLVAGAGLLARSLQEMGRVDPGFDPTGRVTARLDLPPGGDNNREALALYLDGLVAALNADPSLQRVALASSIPFGTEYESMAVLIPGVSDDPNNLPVVQQRRVSDDFFEVAGVPVLAGRSFSGEDRVESTLVAVVDETFANAYFPGEDPIGRAIRYPWRGAPDMRIVGVVGPTADENLATPPSPTVWMPLGQFAGGLIGHAVVIARASSDSDAALAALQSRSWAFDERIAISELVAYPQRLRDSLAAQRLLTVMLLLFAGSTLALGCVGVYGVAAFSARERVREIGVRMTLGAHPSEIRASILRQGLWLALPGGLLGLVLAAFAGRLLGSFLYGVSILDPITFVLTPLLLVGAALAAVYLPARRATMIDPSAVLREG